MLVFGTGMSKGLRRVRTSILQVLLAMFMADDMECDMVGDMVVWISYFRPM